jgi:hypothetical protein
MPGIRELLLQKIIEEQTRYADECAERGDDHAERYHRERVTVRRLEYFRRVGVWPEMVAR